MSELFSGKGNPFYGKHHTDETKKKISENRKGKTAGEAHPFYGKHHTDETKNKISENRKGKGGRKVRCINTGEIFNSLGDAARWCGLKNCTGISQVCLKNGK
jgi:group I intron endonuclease